ncbi:hypothetical protein EVAR_59988_1 [Eumeta japonica]|uniref:Uncharacterized protein n=1 Tax=Eumeta variegata TaxID=151549 RepID=A0A4C1ZK80_EUMVA|nr:hypothetical protein EVAR_59988_1 [Eumeta japonica]
MTAASASQCIGTKYVNKWMQLHVQLGRRGGEARAAGVTRARLLDVKGSYRCAFLSVLYTKKNRKLVARNRDEGTRYTGGVRAEFVRQSGTVDWDLDDGSRVGAGQPTREIAVCAHADLLRNKKNSKVVACIYAYFAKNVGSICTYTHRAKIFEDGLRVTALFILVLFAFENGAKLALINKNMLLLSVYHSITFEEMITLMRSLKVAINLATF